MGGAMKQLFKRGACVTLNAMGPHLPTRGLRHWAAQRLGPALLDERVLARRLTARQLRGGPAVLCDPYRYVHRLPYWTGRLHEEDLEGYLRAEVRPGDTIIDVGANCGHFTVLGAHLAGGKGRVYAFEPIPRLADAVMTHCRSQGFDHVEMFRVALGESDATAGLHVRADEEGVSNLRGPVPGGDTEVIDVPVRRGDDVLAGKEMPGRAFLKMDVEGFELPALGGLRQVLSTRVAHAVIEVTPGWLGPGGTVKLFDLMESCGLQARRLEGGGALRPDEVGEQDNVLFTRG
jgi:FkbM family methyltransferase